MPSQAMFAFIEKAANDEVFRAELIANPAEVIAGANLDEAGVTSIRNDAAWTWLRDLWNAPPGW